MILPWFTELASKNQINIEELGITNGPNGIALSALKQFEKGVTLELDAAGIDVTHTIALAIANEIACSTQDPSKNTNHLSAMAHTTFWDKLIGDLCPTYMFAIIPTVETAIAVPFIPGLQKVFNPGKDACTFMARDYEEVDVQSALPRVLRGMGIFTGQGFRFDGILANNGWTQASIGGYFEGQTTGMVMLTDAPSWLSEVVVPDQYSNVSTGAGGTVKNTAIHPAAGPPQPPGVDPKTLRNQTKNILDRWAQARYANEILKDRSAMIGGAVRYDIAPGSTVSLEGVLNNFITGKNGLGETRYASVIQVTNFFNAMQPAAGTSYQLAYVRNSAENKAKATSLPRHPLYKTVWTGSQLIDKQFGG